MATSKPVQSSQIIEPNALDPIKKEFIDLNALLGVTEDKLKDVVAVFLKMSKATPLDSLANLEKREKGIKDSKDALQELEKVEKDRLKLQAKIKELDDKRIKVNFELKEQIIKQSKALKENTKERGKALDNYEKLVKKQNESEKELLRLTTAFGKNSDIVKESKKEYLSLTAQIEDINKVRKKEEKQLTSVEKLQKKLNDLNADSVKEEFELKEQIRLQTKELRDNAKASAEAADAYEKLKKDTNAAQLEGKKLEVQFGKNSKEAKEAAKRFNTLNDQLEDVNKSYKDGRRDVGRYEKGTQKLNKAFKAFAAATVVLKILELLQKSVASNSEGVASLEKVWVRLTTVITVVANRLVTAFPIAQAKFEQFVLSVRIGALEITNLFGSNAKETKELQKQYEALSETASGDLSKTFDNLGAEVTSLTAKKVKLIDDTLAYRKEIAGLETQIAKLLPTQAKLRAGFDDDSKSLKEQLEDGILFRKSLQETQTLEEKISAMRLKLAQENVLANGNNIASHEELAAATLANNQLIADNSEELIESQTKLNKVRSDMTELNLDFYVDDADNRKTINERIIADETQTFERRKALLKENEERTELANDLRAAALNTTLRRMGKEEIDFEKLRNTQSIGEVSRIVRLSGLSEQLSIRVLEIIRERRTELQDNVEAQRDLNDAEEESLALQDDIILQERALNKLQENGVDLQKVLKELSEARLQSDIDNLRERIALTTAGSPRFIALNKELNDKLLEQDQQRIEKQKESLKKFGEAASEGFSLLSDLANKQLESRLSEIDKEISAEEKRIDRLKELAAEGNEDAENNIAISEQRQAQLELEREQQLKRQKQSELALTALQTYGAKVSAGDKSPLASTIADISVLRAFVSSLPGFYDGTEDTGTVATPIDGKGGRLAVLHDNERVIDKANNKLIGRMSNTELAMMANREQNKSSNSDLSQRVVVKELQELKKITSEKPVYLGSDFDQIANMVITKVKTGNKLEKTHRKSGGIWG